MEEIQQTRIRCARKDSSVYPARLKELPGMPKQLYYIGSFPDDAKPTAAIVGASPFSASAGHACRHQCRCSVPH